MGNYQDGFSGDGGPALNATLLFPAGLAFDGSGNLYISDSGNFRIRQVSGGAINTVAGNGLFRVVPDGTPETQAFLFGPNGIGIDSSGNLLIAEVSHSQVAKIGPDGSFSVIAGVGASGASVATSSAAGSPAKQALLDTPRQVISDPQGNIYFSDNSASVVYKLTPDGEVVGVCRPVLPKHLH